MGSVFFYDEEVTAQTDANDSALCSVEVVDNHGVPEVRIGSVEGDDELSTARFEDWDQYERFVDAVNSVYDRLKGVKQ